MNFTIEQAAGTVPVTILETHGVLDRTNYEELIAIAQDAHRQGTQDILLDLSDTPFISSSGLVALHAIALLLRGEKLADLDSGWEAFHSMDRDLSSGYQKHLKLLNPQPRVQLTLEKTGFNQFFEVFTDRESAIASFA